MVQQSIKQEKRFFGREFSVEELQLIQDIVNDFRALSVTKISETICELLEWKRPNGHLKSHECRQMLERLSDQGLLKLPQLQRKGPQGPRVVELSSEGRPQPQVIKTAAELEPLSLKVVKAGDRPESRLWRELIARYHYLGYRPHVGANLRYLCYSEQKSDEVLVCMLWTSPAWKIEVRDRWIGWDNETRSRNLQLIVNNARFLIMPWVRSTNLASKILALCARQVPVDWEEMYGYRPLLLESMVDKSRFRGTCYRAANWELLGETKGRGRMDRWHSMEGNAPKLVYVYGLCRNVQKRLVSATAPSSDHLHSEESEWAEA
jgi:uncharacterized protein DUF4338